MQDGINTLELPLLGGLDGKTGDGVSEFLNTLTDGIRSIGQFTPRLESYINEQLSSILGPREEGKQYATINTPTEDDIVRGISNLDFSDLIATLDFNFERRSRD